MTSPAINTHAAQKLFDLLQQAELAHRMKGTRHADYIKSHSRTLVGQAKREAERMAALGDDAGVFCDLFLREFGV